MSELDKKYIVSSAYLATVRERVKEMMRTVQEEPLIYTTKKVRMLSSLSEIVEMLSPDIAEKELVPHVCRCGERGKDGEKKDKD